MPHLLIVSARFYDDISDALERGARDTLREAAATWDTAIVPGALEIAPAIRFALDTGKYDGFVALGCVIRGETSHYETVCAESARGLTWLALEHCAAIGNGILTVENEKQARVRADTGKGKGNKGGAAAAAALALITLKKHPA